MKAKVLSLGAGVQSSALLLAYENGVLKDKPDFAVFADTKAEPRYVYDWLEKLKGLTSIPIAVVSAGNMVQDMLQTDRRFASIPFFIKNLDGSQGMGRRQCTSEYKVKVVQKETRERLGYKKGAHCKHQVEMVLGISLDEVQRMRDNPTPWMDNSYPLIDILEWDRQDCINYINSLEIGSPPKSACYICPYRNNDSWKKLKRDEPDSFNLAVEFEKNMQAKDRSKPGEYRGTPFLHRSCLPLDEIDFDSFEPNPPLFGNDCEGMCGV